MKYWNTLAYVFWLWLFAHLYIGAYLIHMTGEATSGGAICWVKSNLSHFGKNCARISWNRANWYWPAFCRRYTNKSGLPVEILDYICRRTRSIIPSVHDPVCAILGYHLVTGELLSVIGRRQLVARRCDDGKQQKHVSSFRCVVKSSA